MMEIPPPKKKVVSSKGIKQPRSNGIFSDLSSITNLT